MLAQAKQLPEEVASLKEIVQTQKVEIIRLNEIITLLRRKHFGPRSEKDKTPSEQLELGLFNEAEELAKREEAEEEKQTDISASRSGTLQNHDGPLGDRSVFKVFTAHPSDAREAFRK